MREGDRHCCFCGNRKTEGPVSVMCYSCGVKWEGEVIIETLDDRGERKKWEWVIVPEGCLVVRVYGVGRGGYLVRLEEIL